MYGFLCLSSLQIPEELYKNIYTPKQRVRKEEMNKNRWFWKELVSVQTWFGLKCTISKPSNAHAKNFTVKRSNTNSPLVQAEFTYYSFLLHKAFSTKCRRSDKYLWLKITEITHISLAELINAHNMGQPISTYWATQAFQFRVEP